MTDIHGGDIYSRPVRIDFSANINPLGMPENVRKAVINSADLWEKYPDPYCTELRSAVAGKINLSPEQIVIGNGAADLIYRIVQTFRPRKCVITAPSFSEYEKALNENECDISYFLLREENDFEVTEDFPDMIDENTDMVFITSPNNPTGRTVPLDILKRTAEKCLNCGCILVADECFMDFVADSSCKSIFGCLNPNVIVLKAFTKIYAVPGLRLGYAVCGDSEKAELLGNTGQFWSVSAPAQAAGKAALDNEEYLQKTSEIISSGKQYIEKNLSEMGIRFFRSEANFILLKTSLPLYDLLLEKGILIRKCGNYRGLSDDFFRIAVRTHEENKQLTEAIERCINGQTDNDSGNDVKCR